MFDPRLLDKVLTKRDEEARESATQFAADLEGGRLDPSADGFNQGLYQLAPVPEQPPLQQQDKEEDKGAEEEGKEEEGKTAAVAEKQEAGMCLTAPERKGSLPLLIFRCLHLVSVPSLQTLQLIQRTLKPQPPCWALPAGGPSTSRPP